MVEFFLKAFISLFVAIDVVGSLPIFAGLTKHMPSTERAAIFRKACIAALTIGLIFIFGGKAIFHFLGITDNDFRIAGGILLLIFAVKNLVSSDAHQGTEVPTSVGIVPLAVPLIMGPAALATLMLSSKEHGTSVTVAALILNVLITWAAMSRVDWLLKKLGSDISDAMAKIFSLLLAAIGVMLIRQGITPFFSN